MKFLFNQRDPQKVSELANRDPYYDMNNWLENYLESFLSRPNAAGHLSDKAAFSPRLEVKEFPDRYEVSAELPGMPAKDVHIHLEDNQLVLRGEKRFEKREDNQGRVYSEISYGNFLRTIPLPQEVDPERVKAAFNQGILTVTLGKSGRPQDKVRRIEISP